MAERKIICVRCGKETAATGPSQKYCPSCASHVRLGKLSRARDEKRGRASKQAGETKHITCVICGADVVVSLRAGRAIYCHDCSTKAYAASKKRYRTKQVAEDIWQEPEVNLHRCLRCGVEFEHRGFRKYCEDCRIVVRREQDRARRQGVERKPRTESTGKKKPRVSRIDAIQRAAQAAGMSYGKYKAMMEMQKMKKGA